MTYGTIATDVIQSSTTGTPTQFQDGTGTQIGTLCRAWVTFNPSSGTAVVQASFNVSSVTRNSTGQYTVSFTNSLVDGKYAALATENGSPSGYGMATSPQWNGANTASSAVIATLSTGAFIDPQWVSFAAFR